MVIFINKQKMKQINEQALQKSSRQQGQVKIRQLLHQSFMIICLLAQYKSAIFGSFALIQRPCFFISLLLFLLIVIYYNSYNCQLMQILQLELPTSLTIGQNQFGLALYATRDFQPGQEIYKNKALFIEQNFCNLKFRVAGQLQTYEVDYEKCTAKLGAKRVQYTFDGFMNHSCNPNTAAETIAHDSQGIDYREVCISPIKSGDQLTCDYALFDFNSRGQQFICQCRSENCRGFIKGFSKLQLSQKVKLLPKLDPELKTYWLRSDSNVKIYEDLAKPDCVTISQNEKQRCLISERAFKPGDLMWRFRVQIISQKTNVIVKLNEYFLEDIKKISLNRGEYRQFLLFQSFMNHSCDPNSISLLQGDHYQCHALKAISPGDEVTCDYGEVDPLNDLEPFECFCGSLNCKKII